MQELMRTTTALSPDDRPKLRVGIDDGYACTKLALPDGRLLAVPSSARVGRSKVTWMPRAEQMIFEYETEKTIYSVGDVDAEATQFDGYAVSGLNRAIVQHALQCADLEGVDISAVSGLPVSAFYRNTGSRRQGAIDAKRESLLMQVVPKNAALSADIVEHDVLPEALAAWYDHVIVENDGAAALDRSQVSVPIAVIDIGGRTTDTVVVRDQGIVHGSSGSCALGLLDAAGTLADALEERFDLPGLEQRMINKAFERQSIRLFGRDYDVGAEVFAAKQELVERLHGEVRRQLGSAVELDQVLIVGGGALALREFIAGWFPNQVVAKQPAFANARGMLKYLRYVCGDTESRK